MNWQDLSIAGPKLDNFLAQGPYKAGRNECSGDILLNKEQEASIFTHDPDLILEQPSPLLLPTTLEGIYDIEAHVTGYSRLAASGYTTYYSGDFFLKYFQYFQALKPSTLQRFIQVKSRLYRRRRRTARNVALSVFT